jgi:GrpB-like predicted nucleotidyltransferase (UPF0157 family)
MTKRENESVLIGGLEMVEIRIVDYDPNWPAQYQTHAKKIAEALDDAVFQENQANCQFALPFSEEEN